MTTHTGTIRTGRPVTQRPAGHHILRDHTVTGTASQLATLVAHHRNAGTLVALTAPRPVTGDRFQVVIRLRERVPARPTVRVTPAGGHARTLRRSRRTRTAVIVTAITGTIAGLVAVAAYLIGQLVELIAAHAALILGVLVLAAIAALAARGSGRRHCPAADRSPPEHNCIARNGRQDRLNA
jgi:VIT1/CCC1 family predicted Fe2+/Mn2+ transporter